jgi:PAS domain S-box-containing protein
MREPDPLENESALVHLLVSSVKDHAIFALDPEGRIRTWNIGAQQIKGYEAAEVLGRPFSIFFMPEDQLAGRPELLLERARREGRVEDYGWRVRKDGTRFWANVVLTALYSPAGELLGFAKITRDLTERRAADEALHRRERQLLETQRLAGLGSWEWDVRANTVTWTEELYRIYGLDPQAFGATFEAYMDRVHPEDRERVRRIIEEAYGSGGSFEFEERIIRPDGEVRVLRSQGEAAQNEAGEITHLRGACLDITKLRKAEAAEIGLAREQAARETAAAAAARLRFLLQATEILAASLDYEDTLRNVAKLAVPAFSDWCAVDLVEPAGVLHRVAVEHTDPSLVELAQDFVERYPPRRERGEGAWRVIDTEQPEYLPEISDELLVASAVDADQLAILRRLGLRSALSVPLTGRSGPLGALSLVQAESGRRFSESDIQIALELGRHAGLAIQNARLHRELEERNRTLEETSLELELTVNELEVRTREAESANRAKSDFLAAMSHELRTPLNAIFGYAELMQLGLHGPITTAQRDALERIKHNQRALLVLINDVLNFAKLEAGRLEVRITDVPVAEVISDLEKLVGPQLAAKGLIYECSEIPSGVQVRGERERIEQILINLLTNAIKFTDPGGSIRLSFAADNDTVRMTVSDTGRGIPADRLDSIFDPFIQIHEPAEPGTSGVGLGLAISRDLATAMKGTLTVTSRVGEGSNFTLALPRSLKPAQQLEETS